MPEGIFARQIANALTQDQFAVVVHARLDKVVVELVRHAGATIMIFSDRRPSTRFFNAPFRRTSHPIVEAVG